MTKAQVYHGLVDHGQASKRWEHTAQSSGGNDTSRSPFSRFSTGSSHPTECPPPQSPYPMDVVIVLYLTTAILELYFRTYPVLCSPTAVLWGNLAERATSAENWSGVRGPLAPTSGTQPFSGSFSEAMRQACFKLTWMARRRRDSHASRPRPPGHFFASGPVRSRRWGT